MYKIEKIDEYLYKVLDKENEAIIVYSGNQKAIVFDTGLDDEPLKPVIDSILDVPYDVIASHGHFDHIGRSGDFDTIYMNHKDEIIYDENDHSDGLNIIEKDKIRDIQEGDYFDLGDRTAEVIELSGHTPGSILLVDKEHQLVLTGDAIGSGCGVWMQLNHCSSIKEYHDELVRVKEILDSMGCNDDWFFIGGHAYQEYQSQVSKYNKFDYRILKDMIVLCEKLVSGEIVGTSSPCPTFSERKALYASYGKAEIIYTKEQL